ncbi:MAG: baseplate J/gp47 family protein [Thiofilum sp.]|uniref:baseplate J/gp47 family protein n=1 Tax=Thiofilum sp. TaxID=2212733 RepID=UPI0025EBA210|nr:baseplate J/gp47 family protein [Thiofilum sp.]MBK8454762.1 baseplate J/gp47 family protein [Thiofilum sp.]
MIKPPIVDTRTAPDIAQAVLRQAGWNSENGNSGGEVSRALIDIFAYFCGQVIERINRIPEKQFLAFLSLLGYAPLSARPAHVPVTFVPHKFTGKGVLIPAATQVTAPPPLDSAVPLVFETDQDLWLTPVQLQKIRFNHNDSVSPLFDAGQELANDVSQSGSFDLGFAVQGWQGTQLSVYVELEDLCYEPELRLTEIPQRQLEVNMVYQPLIAASENRPVSVLDDQTQGLTQSGMIILELASEVTPLPLFGEKEHRLWLNCTIKEKDTVVPSLKPHIRWISTNTVPATQQETINSEILGSSNGTAEQIFQTQRASLLPGQQLEVLEQRVGDPNLPQQWTTWTAVIDFRASLASDRHYILDSNKGLVFFGDGQQGMIPPAGVRNIRLLRYQVTQGKQGNIQPHSLQDMMLSSPFVSKVVNRSGAYGGVATESLADFMQRAHSIMRHRDRAVTARDFEEIAKLASPEIAFAKCFPLLDLRKGSDSTTEKGGQLSVWIMPHSQDLQPQPTLRLIKQVQDYLLQRTFPNVSVHVLGIDYLPVTVRVALAGDVLEQTKQVINKKLFDFLHPLYGNKGNGWNVGEVPSISDIYFLLRSVEINIKKIQFNNLDGEITLGNKSFIICSHSSHVITSES